MGKGPAGWQGLFVVDYMVEDQLAATGAVAAL